MRLYTALLICFALAQPSVASVLYGGVGRGSDENPGSLIWIDQNSGTSSLVGPAPGVEGISGLAFDTFGDLFATSISSPVFDGGSSSTLLRLNPSTAAILSEIPITFGGAPLSINDLAVHPQTGMIFGTEVNLRTFSNFIYTIDRSTGTATFVGDTGRTGATLAFSPTGVLYMTTAEFTEAGGFVRGYLNTVDPLTAAVLTTSAPYTQTHVGGLAVRPEDGVIFASGDRRAGIYTISPGGTMALVGFSTAGAAGDIAFSNVPEPTSISMVVLGALGILIRKFRRA